jgi:hypothetical protein
MADLGPTASTDNMLPSDSRIAAALLVRDLTLDRSKFADWFITPPSPSSEKGVLKTRLVLRLCCRMALCPLAACGLHVLLAGLSTLAPLPAANAGPRPAVQLGLVRHGRSILHDPTIPFLPHSHLKTASSQTASQSVKYSASI